MKHYYNLILLIGLINILTNCQGQTNTEQNIKVDDIDIIYKQILNDSILVTGWYFLSDIDNGFKRQLDKLDENYYIIPKPIVVKGNFEKLEIYETNFKGAYPDYIGLSIKLDVSGTEAWAEATKKAMYSELALIINNKLIYVPQVNAQITNERTDLNRGDYTRNEIEKFKMQIENE